MADSEGKRSLLAEAKATRDHKTGCLMPRASDTSDSSEFGQASPSSEKQFQEVVNRSLVGIYQTTPDGRILMANPALVKMLGYSSFDDLAQRNLEKDAYEPQYTRSTFKERIDNEGKLIGR